MATPVPGQKYNITACQPASHIAVRWLSPRRIDDLLLLSFKTGHGIQAAAAYDADPRCTQRKRSSSCAVMRR